MNRETWSLCWGWICLGLSLCPTGAAAELLFETMPVPRSGGFRMDGYWVWDPSVVKAADGKWHLFASRWPHSNPMHPTWLLTSEIVRAEGSRPEGPFEFKEVVFKARGPAWWDGRSVFNPRVMEIVEQGRKKYLMFYAGSTHPFPDFQQAGRSGHCRSSGRALATLGSPAVAAAARTFRRLLHLQSRGCVSCRRVGVPDVQDPPVPGRGQGFCPRAHDPRGGGIGA